jgi:hypothetical protein
MGCLISFEVESIYKYMADVKLKLNLNIEKKIIWYIDLYSNFKYRYKNK